MINVYSIGGQQVAAPVNLDPSAINAGAFNTELITSFDRDLFKLVYMPNEVNRHPRTKDFDFDDLVKYLGFQIPIQAGAGGKYGHFEKERTTQTLVIDANGVQGAGGAGQPVSFDLDVATIYTDPQTGRKYSYARLKQILHIQVNHTTIINAWVSSIVPTATSQTITIVADDASVDLLAILGGAGGSAGVELASPTNAYAEGSRQGQTLQQRYIRYQNNLQIIKEDDKITGSAMTRAYTIKEVPLEFDGQKGVAYEVQGAEEAQLRFKHKKNGAICFGTISDNIFENNPDHIESELVGMPVRTTQGIFPYIFQNGNIQPYTIGGFGIQDIDAYNDILDAEAAPLNYIWCYGTPFGQELREVLKEYSTDDTMNKYVMGEIFGNVGNEDMQSGLALAVSFQSIRLMPSPRTFHFKNLTSFNDPEMMGNASYTYKNMSFLMPYGTFKNNMSKVQRTEMFGELYNSEEMPYWGYCYSAKNGYNREVELWDTGAAGGERLMRKYTDDYDIKRLHLRGEFGAWNSAANLFIAIHPA